MYPNHSQEPEKKSGMFHPRLVWSCLRTSLPGLVVSRNISYPLPQKIPTSRLSRNCFQTCRFRSWFCSTSFLIFSTSVLSVLYFKQHNKTKLMFFIEDFVLLGPNYSYAFTVCPFSRIPSVIFFITSLFLLPFLSLFSASLWCAAKSNKSRDVW